MSRWRQNASYSELVKIHRAIADAKEALDLERAQDVRAARAEARVQLGAHGLFTASFATGQDPERQSVAEYERLRQRIIDGGYHKVRKAAGGSLDV